MYGGRHHLDSNLLLELTVGAFRPIDRTHAAMTDRLEQPVRTQLFAHQGKVPGRIRTDLRLHLQERTGTVVSREKRYNVAAQARVASTELVDTSRALVLGELQHGGQDFFDLLPLCVLHDPSSPSSRRYSQARAMFQSRRTVASVVWSTV